ncbi:hypothetical protein NKG99_20395 [Mesorhizobium sp. M1409]|uniref:hypothetical protein n=1 Tax=Mesorhizobium sp. M1409 TaxID=2957100 RepID=UPI0033399DB0
MARIANFTSAGVPSGAAGMTLSELMARQKELAERQASLSGPNPGSSTIAGGLGQMANALFTGLEERKASQQEAEGRQRLTDILTGINPETGATSEQWGQAYQLDPDLGAKLLEGATQARAAARQREQQLADVASQRDWTQGQTAASQAFQEAQQGRSLAATAGQNELTREAAAKAAGTPKISDISGVRQDVISDPSYKNMAQAVPIWSSMQDAATRDTPQADLNMVIALAKLFDPTSVVRQSESGAVELTGNLPAQLAGQFKYLTAKPGSRLPEEVRQGMLAEGWSRVKGYSDAYGKTADFYSNLAKESGIPTEKVVPSFGDLKPYTAPAEVPVPAGPDDRGSTPSSQPQPLPSDLPLIKPNVSYTFPDGRTGVWGGVGNIADQTTWKFTPAPGGG